MHYTETFTRYERLSNFLPYLPVNWRTECWHMRDERKMAILYLGSRIAEEV
jgi:hypothetical protein